VGLLTLYAALLLPWLGGTFWLTFADNHFNNSSQVNRFRQAGYGFFLGYAVLFIAIMASNKFFSPQAVDLRPGKVVDPTRPCPHKQHSQ